MRLRETAGLLLLAIAIVIVWGVRQRVTVTWRLVPVQQSVILPPALGSLTLSPGDRLAQYFTLPPRAVDLLRTSGDLSIDFVSVLGSVPPDVRMTLRNPAHTSLGSWLVPSPAVATHTIEVPVVDPGAGSVGRYELEMQVPLATSTGAAPAPVSLAYTPDQQPGSSLVMDDQHQPGTLGLTISSGIPLTTYLGHYPSMLLAGRATGSALWLAVLHLLWLAGMLGLLGAAVAVSGAVLSREQVLPPAQSRAPATAPEGKRPRPSHRSRHR